MPEDFVVKEVYNLTMRESGRYTYFILKKRQYNTFDAVRQIANVLNISSKNIGFAGNKDRNAITEQAISVLNGKKQYEQLSLKDISLKYVGSGAEPVFLGSHNGNQFQITIRNLTEADIQKVHCKSARITIPNFFGPQRFSQKNAVIGKALVQKQFKKALKQLRYTKPDESEKMRQHLLKNPNDFLGALKAVPLKTLQFYIHAYQALLFNELLAKIHEKKSVMKVETIPLPGFGTEISNENVRKIVNELLDKEHITLRDFIIPQIPELSVEGDQRKTCFTVRELVLGKLHDDDLNKSKKKIAIRFSLPKGSYATVVIDSLFSSQ